MKQGPAWNFFPRASSCSSRGLSGIHLCGGCLIQTRKESTELARQNDTQNGPQWSSAGFCSVYFMWHRLFPWCCWDIKIMGSVLVLHLFFEGKRFFPHYREGWSHMVVGLLGLGHDKAWMSWWLCICSLCLPLICMIALCWASSGLLAISDRLCSIPNVIFAHKFL